jgi:hypothetical protein
LALVGVSVFGVPSSARADAEEDKAAARSAAMSGIQAYEAGRFQEALDLCTRAEAILHAPPHLLYIARAQVKLGQLVRAHETYIKIGREQLAPDAPRAFKDAQAAAQTEEAALAPRVPTLKISVDPPSSNPIVILDGAPVAPALIGLQRPIDPGEHRIEAKSGASRAEPVTITVAESEAREVTLHVTGGALAGAAGAPSTEGGATGPASEAPPASDSASSMRLGAWIGIGVGAAGVVVGTIFLVKNHSNRDDANALCPNGRCPKSQQDQINSLDDSASSAATLSLVAYGVGIVGLGAGAVLLYLSGQSQSKPAASAKIVPWIGPRSAGATVTF